MSFKPVINGIITQPYGPTHAGIDLGVPGNPVNVPVYSARSGIPKFINNDISAGINAGGGLGRYVFILNADGFYSIYAHLSLINFDLHIDEFIPEGIFLGIMGSTGLSTGIHLHYEERTTPTPGHSRAPLSISSLF